MVWPHEYERTRCRIELSGLAMNLARRNIKCYAADFDKSMIFAVHKFSAIYALAYMSHFVPIHTKHSATLASVNASQDP